MCMMGTANDGNHDTTNNDALDEYDTWACQKLGTENICHGWLAYACIGVAIKYLRDVQIDYRYSTPLHARITCNSIMVPYELAVMRFAKIAGGVGATKVWSLIYIKCNTFITASDNDVKIMAEFFRLFITPDNNIHCYNLLAKDPAIIAYAIMLPLLVDNADKEQVKSALGLPPGDNARYDAIVDRLMTPRDSMPCYNSFGSYIPPPSF